MYSFRKMFVMDRAVVSILEIFRTSCYLFLVQDSSLRKSPSVLVAVRAVRPRATDRAKQGGVKRGGGRQQRVNVMFFAHDRTTRQHEEDGCEGCATGGAQGPMHASRRHEQQNHKTCMSHSQGHTPCE